MTSAPTVRSRRSYVLTVEVSLIVVLLLLIGVVKLDVQAATPPDARSPAFDPPHLYDVPPTDHSPEPAPPPRPTLLAVVPDDEILDHGPIAFDVTLPFDRPADVGPPPDAPQQPSEDEPPFFLVVEEMPTLIGGLAAVQSRIRYPEIALRAGVEGQVVVRFVVDEAGRVVDPVVVRGIGAGCDEEALRAVRQARFMPGRQRGKPVRVLLSLPITFRLR